MGLAHQTSAVWWEARGGFSSREKGHWPQHMLDLEWLKNKLRPAEGQGLAQGPQAGCKDRRPELSVLLEPTAPGLHASRTLPQLSATIL